MRLRRRKTMRFPNGIPRAAIAAPPVAPATQRKESAMIRVSSYYKAIVALVGVIGTTIATIAADPSINGVLPTGGAAWVAAAGAAVSTALVWLTRNQPSVEEAESLLERARNRAAR